LFLGANYKNLKEVGCGFDGVSLNAALPYQDQCEKIAKISGIVNSSKKINKKIYAQKNWYNE
jgi:hypothetical protein